MMKILVSCMAVVMVAMFGLSGCIFDRTASEADTEALNTFLATLKQVETFKTETTITFKQGSQTTVHQNTVTVDRSTSNNIKLHMVNKVNSVYQFDAWVTNSFTHMMRPNPSYDPGNEESNEFIKQKYDFHTDKLYNQYGFIDANFDDRKWLKSVSSNPLSGGGTEWNVELTDAGFEVLRGFKHLFHTTNHYTSVVLKYVVDASGALKTFTATFTSGDNSITVNTTVVNWGTGVILTLPGDLDEYTQI
ncbi:MAG: hypothetical protein FWE53_01210 [Firmicutes bacterium]|nr:hypothetical protein [Bacillota bacterium]